jgi:indolepyruvate ferredoxin oxidoreductase
MLLSSLEEGGMGINQGQISLDQKYTQGSGHVFMTGIQALVRLPMAQIRRDRAAGLNTAGFVSGYRGSPLGGYDQQLFSARISNNTMSDSNLA